MKIVHSKTVSEVEFLLVDDNDNVSQTFNIKASDKPQDPLTIRSLDKQSFENLYHTVSTLKQNLIKNLEEQLAKSKQSEVLD